MKIGPYIGPRGADVGPAVDLSMATVDRDAASMIYMPGTIAQANTLLTLSRAPGGAVGLWSFGATALGNVPDLLGSKPLTATGVWLYQQAVAGWDAKSIQSTAGVAAQLINTTLSDVSSQPYTLYLWGKVLAPSTLRYLMHLGAVFDDSVCAQMTNTPGALLQLGNGVNSSRTNGAQTFAGSARPFVLMSGAGSTVDTGVKCALTTDKEDINSGSFGANGSTLMFGGNGIDSWQPAATDYIWGMLVNAAHTLTQRKAVMTTAGWTVSF